jgi:hypothetical protein
MVEELAEDHGEFPSVWPGCHHRRARPGDPSKRHFSPTRWDTPVKPACDVRPDRSMR